MTEPTDCPECGDKPYVPRCTTCEPESTGRSRCMIYANERP